MCLFGKPLCTYLCTHINGCINYVLQDKQEVDDDLSVCMLNILPKVNSLPSLLAIILMKMEIEIFQTVTWPHVDHLIKGSCMGVSNTKSTRLCWYNLCRWRYVFYLSREPTRPLRWDAMHIYGWELLTSCHHPEKFYD